MGCSGGDGHFHETSGGGGVRDSTLAHSSYAIISRTPIRRRIVMRAWFSATRIGFWACVLGVSSAIPTLAGPPRPVKPGPASPGEELFLRVWEPDDARSHGGDGLGPAYNEKSCVACHSLGAPGGAGP